MSGSIWWHTFRDVKKSTTASGNATDTRGLCVGYLYNNRWNQARSKSDKRLRSYVKVLHVFPFISSCLWAVQPTTWCCADAYSQNFWHPCTFVVDVVLKTMHVHFPWTNWYNFQSLGSNQNSWLGGCSFSRGWGSYTFFGWKFTYFLLVFVQIEGWVGGGSVQICTLCKLEKPYTKMDGPLGTT